MKFLPALLFSAAIIFPIAARADDIPDRPEKLNFPPLKYEPPAPDSFRVQLKAGPVADDDQSGKAETPSALDHLGDPVDVDHP